MADPPGRTRVVKRCDGGFDDSWLGSDSDASDEAPPYEDRAAPPRYEAPPRYDDAGAAGAPRYGGGGYEAPPRQDAWAAQDALPPAAAPVADDAEQAALIDAILDGAADQPPAPPKPAPPVPPRRKPMPPVPRPRGPPVPSPAGPRGPPPVAAPREPLREVPAPAPDALSGAQRARAEANKQRALQLRIAKNREKALALRRAKQSSGS